MPVPDATEASSERARSSLDPQPFELHQRHAFVAERRIVQNFEELRMIGMRRRGDVLRRIRGGFVAEADVLLKADVVGADLAAEPRERGHLAKIGALHDEVDSEACNLVADIALGIARKVSGFGIYFVV